MDKLEFQHITNQCAKFAQIITINEPFDGDEVEMIAEIFRIELDFNTGNITKLEYDIQREPLIKQISI